MSSGEVGGGPVPPLAEWLDKVNEAQRERHRRGFVRTPTNVREAFELITRTFVTERPQLPRVLDDLVPGMEYRVPVRVYHPAPGRALPIAVFVHGGGHVAGSVSVYDPIARRLALAARHVVVSVDYRLAPECPYPAGLQDVLTVVKGIREVLVARGVTHADRLALVGDSGGGALSATAAHLLQHEPGVELAALVLIYPSLDYTLSQPSVDALGTGYLLDRDRVGWYFDQYFQHAENRRDASPLFMACDNGFPRTLVLSAEYCLLRDEADAYAQRLQRAGVDVDYVLCEGMIHAFLNLEDLVPDDCRRVYARIAHFLAA